VAWREQAAREKRPAYRNWDYWGKPVPGFGDARARVLVVGLAPGAHGSNRTGRMFTGDASGIFLYTALHRAGFANQPIAHSLSDGLVITDLYISAVCRCVPPKNRPDRKEIANCRPFLLAEMEYLHKIEGIVALGKIAFDEVLSNFQRPGHSAAKYKFEHGGFYQFGNSLPWLIASYHPSQQNTQTGRLTIAMFDAIWKRVVGLLKQS